jgi:DNA end-binding protein Ku
MRRPRGQNLPCAVATRAARARYSASRAPQRPTGHPRFWAGRFQIPARARPRAADSLLQWVPGSENIARSPRSGRDEVDSADIIKGYEVGKGDYIELDPEELEAVAIESKRTIDIDEFVPKDEIDELYLNNPYYIAPDGEVGQQAFAVIREAIRKEGMVAIGKVVFTSREHIIALEARGKGLLGITLRYPYEVRNEADYFDDIPDEKIPKDMLELASHIVKTKAGHFEPSEFEDQYEDALKELLKKKQEGKPIERPERPKPTNVVNLMDALRQSVEASGAATSVKGKARAASPRGSSEKAEHAKPKRTRRSG